MVPSGCIPVKSDPPPPRAVLGIAFAAGLCIYLLFLAHRPFPGLPPGSLRTAQAGGAALSPEPRPQDAAENPAVDLMQVSVAVILGLAQDGASPYDDLDRFWRSDLDIAEVGRIVFSRDPAPPVAALADPIPAPAEPSP